jgi:hypothetical protein
MQEKGEEYNRVMMGALQEAECKLKDLIRKLTEIELL